MPNLPQVAPAQIITAQGWNNLVNDLNPFTQALKIVNNAGSPTPAPAAGGSLFINGVNNWQNAGDEAILFLGHSEYFIKAKRDQGLTIGAKWATAGIVISDGGDTRIGGANPARAKLEVDGGDPWVTNEWSKNLLLTAANPSLTFNYPAAATKFGIGMKHTAGMDKLHIFSTDADLGLNTGAFASHLVIQENGNVGVGKSTPSQKLEVAGDILIEGTAGFNAANEEAKLFLGDGSHFIKSTRGGGAVVGGITIGTWNVPNALIIKEGSGNMGIGTTDPKVPLHVKGNAGIVNVEGSNHAYLQFYPQGFNNGRKSWVGFGSSGTSTLSFVNETIHGAIEISADHAILFNTGSGIRINNLEPIQLRKFSYSNGADTGVSVSLYDAAIIGYAFSGVTSFTALYMNPSGTWKIAGPVLSSAVTGTVYVMFIRKEISTRDY